MSFTIDCTATATKAKDDLDRLESAKMYIRYAVVALNNASDHEADTAALEDQESLCSDAIEAHQAALDAWKNRDYSEVA